MRHRFTIGLSIGRQVKPVTAQFSSYHFHSRAAARFCEGAVSCDEWGIQRFSEGEIGRVIGRDTVPHFRNAREKDVMRISGEGKICEIRKSFRASFGGNDGRADIAAQNLSDFEIHEVRSMQSLIRSEYELIHPASRGRLQENLKNRGSIDDNQRLFLSERTADAGAGCARTGRRLASRVRISSSVGRSSAWRSSRSK